MRSMFSSDAQHIALMWSACLSYEEAIQKDLLAQHLAMFFHGFKKFWLEFFREGRGTLERSDFRAQFI